MTGVPAWQEERRNFLSPILTRLDEAERAQLLHLLERVLDESALTYGP